MQAPLEGESCRDEESIVDTTPWQQQEAADDEERSDLQREEASSGTLAVVPQRNTDERLPALPSRDAWETLDATKSGGDGELHPRLPPRCHSARRPGSRLRRSRRSSARHDPGRPRTVGGGAGWSDQFFESCRAPSGTLSSGSMYLGLDSFGDEATMSATNSAPLIDSIATDLHHIQEAPIVAGPEDSKLDHEKELREVSEETEPPEEVVCRHLCGQCEPTPVGPPTLLRRCPVPLGGSAELPVALRDGLESVEAFHKMRKKERPQHWARKVQDIQMGPLLRGYPSTFSRRPHPKFPGVRIVDHTRLHERLMQRYVRDKQIATDWSRREEARRALMAADPEGAKAADDDYALQLQISTLCLLTRKPAEKRSVDDTMLLFDFVRIRPFYKDLDEALLREGLKAMTIQRFDANTKLWNAGDEIAGLHVMLRGKIKHGRQAHQVTWDVPDDDELFTVGKLGAVLNDKEIIKKLAKPVPGHNVSVDQLDKMYDDVLHLADCTALEVVETIFWPVASILELVESAIRQERLTLLTELVPPCVGKPESFLTTPSKIINAKGKQLLVHELFHLCTVPPFHKFYEAGERHGLDTSILGWAVDGSIVMQAGANMLQLRRGDMLGEELLKQDVYRYNCSVWRKQARLLWIRASDYVNQFNIKIVPPEPKSPVSPKAAKKKKRERRRHAQLPDHHNLGEPSDSGNERSPSEEGSSEEYESSEEPFSPKDMLKEIGLPLRIQRDRAKLIQSDWKRYGMKSDLKAAQRDAETSSSGVVEKRSRRQKPGLDMPWDAEGKLVPAPPAPRPRLPAAPPLEQKCFRRVLA
eukprot:TRINITY_DN101026_c0_g1_i1.p1 TRINITY_DN101026_c0_g1~~TRINITY_DN101026_c0_g1_i1.p1  ORF type:complete len:813 (+),score=140.01 TRINITY_DN101026_c0_g1_i1:74-2512(+)